MPLREHIRLAVDGIHLSRAQAAAAMDAMLDGSAPVLTALGVEVELPPAAVAACIDECGIGFLFAPRHHAAMRHVAPVRKELGLRTLFNLLGPLANPAGARRQLLGVYAPQLVP